MMKKTIIFLTLALSSAPLAAAIYKWTDEQGNIIYSDKPQGQRAKEIKPPPIPTYQAPKKAVKEPAPEQAKEGDQKEQETVTEYSKLAITSPPHDQALRSNAGQVKITLDIKPELDQKAGHQVRIYLDGKAVTTTGSNSATLENVDRGTHTLSAEIIDKDKKSLRKSKSTTFHLQRFAKH